MQGQLQFFHSAVVEIRALLPRKIYPNEADVFELGEIVCKDADGGPVGCEIEVLGLPEVFEMIELEGFECGAWSAVTEMVAGDALANVVADHEVEGAPGCEVLAQHAEDGVHLVLEDCDAICVGRLVNGGDEDCECSGGGNGGVRGRRAGGEDAGEQSMCTGVVRRLFEDESGPKRRCLECNGPPTLADMRNCNLKIQRRYLRAQRLAKVRS